MTSEWSQATLGSIAINEGYGLVDGPFGSNLPASLYADEGVPVIRGSNLALGTSRFRAQEFVFVSWDTAKRLARSLCRPLDIIFTKKGTLGQTGLVPEGSKYDQYLLSSNQMKLTVDPLVADPLFVYYFVSSPESTEKIIRDSEATGVPKTNVTYLREFPITLPPLSEQRAIAHILGTLDDKIELNRRMNETLEAMARAIFKDWFVDFGPTRAKAEGRAPYLAPELWDLFPDALDDEDTPEGWSFAPLTALAEMNPESWSRKNTPEEVEYVDLANTKWGTIEATQRFPWQDAPSRAKRILRPGDTIVGMVRPGNGSFAFVNDSGLTGSTGFAVLRPRESRYTELVFLSATAPENIERLANLADGAAYPAVRPDVVGATEVAFCEDAAATSFSAFVSPLLDRMESNKRENLTLTKTRDLLLPKLMSGEIRLREAEKAAEAVA